MFKAIKEGNREIVKVAILTFDLQTLRRINTVNCCPKRNQKSDDFNADFEHAPIC